jgi:glycosyltransferase involved in cell wall biosynthesis
VLEKQPAARLAIFGDGSARRAREQAAQLGVAASVSFAGFHDDVGAIYDALDVFVLCSLRDESMSHAVLEAMAHARPVVVSEAASGGLEAALERGACRRVPSGDAHALAAVIAELLGDREERERMGRAARELALRDHSLERMTDRLEDLARWRPNAAVVSRGKSLDAPSSARRARARPCAER